MSPSALNQTRKKRAILSCTPKNQNPNRSTPMGLLIHLPSRIPPSLARRYHLPAHRIRPHLLLLLLLLARIRPVRLSLYGGWWRRRRGRSMGRRRLPLVRLLRRRRVVQIGRVGRARRWVADRLVRRRRLPVLFGWRGGGDWVRRGRLPVLLGGRRGGGGRRRWVRRLVVRRRRGLVGGGFVDVALLEECRLLGWPLGDWIRLLGNRRGWWWRRGRSGGGGRINGSRGRAD